MRLHLAVSEWVRTNARGRALAPVGAAFLFAAATVAAPAQAAPAITEYTVGLTPNLAPRQAASGADGNVWFTQGAGTGAIGSISPGGTIAETTGGLAANGTPRGIAAGPDGNLWFTQPGGPDIGKVAPGAPSVTEYSLPAGSSPEGIIAGPEGNLWVTDSGNGGAIWKVTTAGVPTKYSVGLTPNSKPWNIAVGSDGNLWFTENVAGGKIGRVTTATGSISEYPGPSVAANDIVGGPDGNLWFTESTNPGYIGRIDPNTKGVIEYTSGLTPNAAPQDITSGGDGRLYFTERALNGAVGAITPTGTITEYGPASGLTAASGPFGIASGADGSVWFTEFVNPGRIGQLTVSPAASTGAASGVGASSAGLAGSVTPNSLTTSYYFQYGTTPAYGSQTATVSLAASGQSQAVNATIAGLNASTLYHYRLMASNAVGTTPGADHTLTTTTPAPTGGGGAPGPGGGGGTGAPAGRSGVVAVAAMAGSPASTQNPLRLENSASAADGTALVLAQSVLATPSSGKVSVKPAGASAFQALTSATALPVGSTVDATHGTVTIVTALPGSHQQSATFWGGQFQIRQRRDGMTDIYLTGGDFRLCRSGPPKAGKASIARATRAPRRKSHRAVRQLWARDSHGRFSTHGTSSIAIVRGTWWLTQDRCDGTLTRVRQGTVAVQDLATHRQTVVRATQRHLARSRR